MPSATDRARGRRAIELLLRAGALALLGWTLWTELRPAPRARATTVAVRASELPARLAPLTADAAARPLRVDADRAPDARDRAWLRALAASGRTVSWGGALPALAVAVEPVPEPAGGLRVALAAPTGSWTRIADDVGVLDSVRVRRAGAELRLPAIQGAARVGSGAGTASSAPADSAIVRGVLVLGRPSWETRFVTAALEEAGWRVALRSRLAPDQVIRQGELSLDTARVGAVVALDSTAGSLVARDAIARFVRAGGGVVATAEAVSALPQLALLAPGSAGPASPSRAAGDSVSRDALALRPIAALRGDAVPLERRGASVAVAARRAGAGRIVMLGYADTWRWRMSGGDSGAASHRRWWSSLVAGVAYAPVERVAGTPGQGDPAPLAATVHALGAATPAAGDDAPRRSIPRPGAAALAAMLVLLLAEWVSRRLRGAP